MLTVYLVLLVLLPSNMTITALGAFGRPQFLWGLVLFAWWLLYRLQAPSIAVRPIRQPVRFALALFSVVALLSFAQALLRGQPFDQVSPSVSALLRLVSWAGVALVAMDGIRTAGDLARLAKRISIVVGIIAALGIVQFATSQPIIDFLTALPGFSGSAGIDERGGFTRSSGTATNPLEYATALSATLPLAVATAVNAGSAWRGTRAAGLLWTPVALIAVASFIAVSRSAIIGFIVALIATVPAVPRRYRPPVIASGVVLAAGTAVAVPGLFGTVLGMFVWFGEDSSTQSRTAGLELASRFAAESPILGAGIGTFLPRYYIFDNQWAQLTVEMGILGVGSFALLVMTAVWGAYRGAALTPFEDMHVQGRALGASLIAVAVLFALFDGLAFPISAGLAFLLIGMSGSMLSVGSTDARLATAMGRKAGPRAGQAR